MNTFCCCRTSGFQLTWSCYEQLKRLVRTNIVSLSFPAPPLILPLFSTSYAKGSCFVRTDQLDGETDWKLRVAVPACQALRNDEVSYTKMDSIPTPAYPHHTHTTPTYHTLHPPHPHTSTYTHHTHTHQPIHTTPCTHHTHTHQPMHTTPCTHHTHTHLRSSFTSVAQCMPNTHTRTFTTSLADSQWCVHLCASLCICVRLCASLCICVCLCASVCISVRLCASLCVCVHLVHTAFCLVLDTYRKRE